MTDEREQLADLIAEARDDYPRVSDDMDSGELAELICDSSWIAAHAKAAVDAAVMAEREAAAVRVEGIIGDFQTRRDAARVVRDGGDL